MAARFTAYVDRFWADAFGLAVDDLHLSSAVVVTPAPWLAEYHGIYVLRLGPTTLVSAPPSQRSAAADLAVGRDVHDAAREIDGIVVGPSQHAYLDRDDHVAPSSPTTTKVTIADLEPLRLAVPDDEWGEGGFGDHTEHVWAVYADDGATIAAAGNLTDFDGMPADIGVVTHPAHRGRGLARRLTADMTTWAMSEAGAEVVRYRALTTNDASRAVARRAGFTAYGENVAIRVPIG
jgi:GNAT superfamily N-acetyltransferase